MGVANVSRKIVPPVLPSTILYRTQLAANLREVILCEKRRHASRSVYKLVLLCAPAGYGKTTLLASFAASAPLPCCWYFLEQADTDSVLFLRTLLASLCVTFPHLEQPLSAAFDNQFAREASSPASMYRAAVDALCSTIATEVADRFALFLCNYEQINESETLTDLLNYLLAHLPPQAVLVIESRALPRIELAPLIVRDEMVAFESNSLRFSAEEISELARLHGQNSLTAADAEQLALSFDGWIAGILLGTYLGDFRLLPAGPVPRSDASFLRENTATARQRKNLFAYVAGEVFQRNQALYRFLQPTSILQQMDAELCDALLEINDASRQLSFSEQQGLFVSSYEGEQQTIYLCHPVIRDLLSTDLRRQDPERFLALHRRAAVLWHTRLNYDQAVYHALEAHDEDLAIQYLFEVYKQLVQQRRLDTLAHWLRSLSAASKQRSPRLLLIEGNVALLQGQHAAASPLLDQASALIAEASVHTPSAEVERLQAEANILRGRALYQSGDYARAREICLQTLQELPEEEAELRVAAKLRVGICANLLGDFASGILYLQDILHNWHHQISAHQIADIHGVLVNAYYLVGNFALAEHHLARALNFCEQLRDEQGKVNNLMRRAILSREQGRYKGAEADLQEALALARRSVAARGCETSVLANLGFLQLEQGMHAQALAFYADALELAYATRNQHVILSILPNMSLAYLFMGDVASALFLLNKIEAADEEGQICTYEQAERELTHGLILFYQQRYDEAYTCLAAIECALHGSSLRQEAMIAHLRLAACELARSREQEALRWLEDVTCWLADHKHYIHLVLVQLQWLPALFQAVKALPQLGRLRTILGVEPVSDTPVRETEPVSVLDVPSVPRLTIRAFGEPVVQLDGEPVRRWRMARAMELFFFLLDTGSPVSKERIITELWSEFDENVNQTFHSTLHHLRKLFGEACFVSHTNCYILNLAACYGESVWYDVQEFQVQRTEADQAFARDDDAGARGALERMVELYQGDYGRPFSNDWCTFRRDELCTAYLEAHRHLAQIAWRGRVYNESIHHWQQILKVDNCQEEAHYNMMLCYIRQAKRSAALRQYDLCKKILREELGIEPGSTIENLHRTIRARAAAREG